MSNRVRRAWDAPKREDPSWTERWEGPDGGLIICWEIGRDLAKNDPKLEARAKCGELPVLSWKGGVARKIKAKKYGSLFYLAQLQALRREDLDIDLGAEYELTCSKTGVTAIYTADRTKWAQP
jgi:hypothetical protein